MKNVKSNKVYTPHEFVQKLTGKIPSFLIDKDYFDQIHEVLVKYGIEDDDNPLWDYPLDEIDEIVYNKIPVVLVDYYNGRVHEYRWFEIPAYFQWID